MSVSGHGGRASVQTVQGLEAPDWEGSRGCQDEEGQIHAERHGTAGRWRRVLCAGQYEQKHRSVQSSFTHTLSWRDYVSHRFDSSSQGEGGVSVVHQSGPPAPEWVMLWVVGCIMKTSLHCGSTFTFLHLPGVFVLSDFAGVGAWGGTRCDSGEGVELWHNLPGENLLLFSELNFFLVVVVRTVWSLAEFKNEEKLCRIFPCHPALCP